MARSNLNPRMSSLCWPPSSPRKRRQFRRSQPPPGMARSKLNPRMAKLCCPPADFESSDSFADHSPPGIA
eukprot:7847219-Pyramimonas_sp.AAC.1